MELPEVDTSTWNQPNISSNVVTSDVESILKDKSHAEYDEFEMARKEDETLDE